MSRASSWTAPLWCASPRSRWGSSSWASASASCCGTRGKLGIARKLRRKTIVTRGMGAQANEALATAAAELGGVLVRTSTSVIGKRGSESIIVATAGWGYTVTVVVSGLRVAFTLRPRGWLRRSLAFEGSPIELAREIVDAAHLERVAALAPILVELG